MNHYLTEFNRLLNLYAYKYHTIEVFRDFCRSVAISLSSPFYSYQFEAEYKSIMQRYEKKEQDIFPKMLTVLVQALEKEPYDFLGEAFMSNDMGSSYKGQYFTPQAVSDLTALMGANDLFQLLDTKEYVTLSEPACGAGSMIIALVKVFIEKGLNHSRQLYVEAKDIDALCADMTYIQLSLLGVSATVIWGDTLANTTNRALKTPVYFLEQWGERLKDDKANQNRIFTEAILDVMRNGSEHSNDVCITQSFYPKAESF